MTAPRPTGSVRRRAHAAGLPAPLPPIWRRTHPLPPASAEPLEPRRLLATFTVTTTADAGPGSLRQAILDANAAPDADQITFAIPSPVDAIQTIRPLSALPDVTGTTTILAPTQSGTVRGPKVQLDGSAAGPAADGLTIRGANSIVSGLSVFDFAGNGIVVRDGTGTRVSSCYVGF